jgi:serine/threonine protein kinase
LIGKTLAQYEITGILGKGGMGEVYRARDSKLGREVAIKVLPKEMSGDPEREARFDREARALASLQHANVASIYGFEHVDDVQLLVMELVEGNNLEHRMLDGAIPHDEVLRLARQIAAGLEAAHDKGIVHRDLKPANVMLTSDGDVKILDFGLARAWFGDNPEEESINTSPTITAAMTQAGTILGTAAYMSPEQARGKSVDRRADIWAFGVILWEMLTGKRLFEGETVSDTLAAVIRAEPDWELLPTEEHPVLCRLIERCLTRDARQRLRDIGEARIVLEDPDASASQISVFGIPAAPADDEAASKPPLIPMAIIALLFSALGLGIGWKLLATAPEAQLLHTMIPGPSGLNFRLDGSSPGPASLSPNGKMLTFAVNTDDGASVLFLRHLDHGLPLALSGTEGAAYPFWSPDSQYIGFFTASGDQKLKKVSVNGSPPVTLCPADNGKGGTWNEDGVILFAPDSSSPIHRVSSIGGDPVPITELAAGENSHRHPRFLPGGREFLFLARGNSGSGALHPVRLGSLDSDSTRVITQSECQAEYSEGHLLTVRENVLLATPFDLSAASLTGGATPLVENILIVGSNAAAGVYSVSINGMISFQTGHSSGERILEWQELETENTAALPTIGRLWFPKISPDGKHCVVEVWGESQGDADLWLVDLETGLRTRFTFIEGNEIRAVWTPDSRSVIYASVPSVSEATTQILQQSVDGVGGAAILYESDRRLRPSDVSPDGAFVYLDYDNEGNVEIVRIPLGSDGDPEDAIATEDDEGGARTSPNGKWIAYHAASANRWDVFVSPVEGGRRKWQISTEGGVWPQWKSDGSELFVNSFDGSVLAFTVDTESETFGVGSSRVVARAESPSGDGTAYSIHPDGTRILRTGMDPSATSEISLVHLVTDWRRGLAR